MAAVTQLPKPLRYFDGVTPVQLGDVVWTRPWFSLFRKKEGRAVYVPGIYAKHGEFEHHDLTWIGVKSADGGIFGIIVLPDTGCLQKNLASSRATPRPAKRSRRIRNFRNENRIV